jgi:hypothetical protein
MQAAAAATAAAGGGGATPRADQDKLLRQLRDAQVGGLLQQQCRGAFSAPQRLPASQKQRQRNSTALTGWARCCLQVAIASLQARVTDKDGRPASSAPGSRPLTPGNAAGSAPAAGTRSALTSASGSVLEGPLALLPAPAADADADSDGEELRHEVGRPALSPAAAGAGDGDFNCKASRCANRAAASAAQNARHAAAQQVLLLVAELMPRLVPALTSKARVEVLPLLQLLICCHPSAEARKHMLALLVNLVPGPDMQQRQVGWESARRAPAPPSAAAPAPSPVLRARSAAPEHAAWPALSPVLRPPTQPPHPTPRPPPLP